MSNQLPLVQLKLLRPIVSGLRERGIDPLSVLEIVGLTEAAIEDDEAAVHVMVIHQFLEECAVAVGDPTFCASIGSRLDPSGWPMIADAIQISNSLGDFLAIYVSRANEVATSVKAYLEVRGNTAHFGEERIFRPTIVPAQNDGFMISLSLSILKRALGPTLDPSRMILVMCDPSVLPDTFTTFQVLKGDRMGFRIQFPAEWLTLPIDGISAPSGEHGPAMAEPQFLFGFRRLLLQNVGNGGLDAKSAAQLTAMSRWKLARVLASHGTDISSEIARARLDFAQDRLANSEQSIEGISAALGYSDPANFSRAFAKENGQSPSKFRRSQRQAQ